jgi:hypothetical protein
MKQAQIFLFTVPRLCESKEQSLYTVSQGNIYEESGRERETATTTRENAWVTLSSQAKCISKEEVGKSGAQSARQTRCL